MEFQQSDVLKQLPKQFCVPCPKGAEKVQEGADIINLGQGNPDQPTPPHIVKAMQEAVAKPENHQYSSFRGTAKLKRLLPLL